MLMELMLMESSRALTEAQRFRSRVQAITLAENAAELAARDLVDPDRNGATIDAEDPDGKMDAAMTRNGTTSGGPFVGRYDIVAHGAATGVQPVRATVHLQGRIAGNRITIDYAYHSQ